MIDVFPIDDLGQKEHVGYGHTRKQVGSERNLEARNSVILGREQDPGGRWSGLTVRPFAKVSNSTPRMLQLFDENDLK